MIVVLARLKIKEGTAQPFIEVAKKLAEASRNEPGMRGYELLRESDHAFSFLERYVDEAAIEAHRKTDHFRMLGREMGAFLHGKPEVIRLDEVN